jgi:hypothetical protein
MIVEGVRVLLVESGSFWLCWWVDNGFADQFVGTSEDSSRWAVRHRSTVVMERRAAFSGGVWYKCGDDER